MFSAQVAAEISTINLFQRTKPVYLPINWNYKSNCFFVWWKSEKFWQQDIEEIKRFADVSNFSLRVWATRGWKNIKKNFSQKLFHYNWSSLSPLKEKQRKTSGELFKPSPFPVPAPSKKTNSTTLFLSLLSEVTRGNSAKHI